MFAIDIDGFVDAVSCDNTFTVDEAGEVAVKAVESVTRSSKL